MTELMVGRPDSLPEPEPYDLRDRFRAGSPPVLLTGVQAIARLLVEQREHDRREGRRTASFVSGYQGSPLGGVDRMLAEMPDVLEAHDIRFVPGLNEELAATSVWGTQQPLDPAEAVFDGVVGYWYGKAPGVDRATDALRHANMYGVDPRGGAVILAGDDPASKSSTVPAVSERTLAALGIPVLFPRNAAEIVTLGLHAVTLSRASGCLVGLKIVADVADGSWVVDRPADAFRPVVPSIEWDGKPWSYAQAPMIVNPDAIVGAEAQLVGPRTETVLAYAAANPLNVVDIDPPHATIGFVAAGTTYDALRQAFLDLNLTDDALHAAGIRVLRLGLVTPLEPGIVEKFATGLGEIVVVEDKTAFIETQVREILYGMPDAPRVIGKKDTVGRRLVPADGEVTSGRLLAPLRHVLDGRVRIEIPRPQTIPLPLLSTSRAPYFCSGCPHNRSTAVPEGSLAGGGIGCHIMVSTSGREDSAVTGFTQMGAEGSQWIGQSGFTRTGHIFQNLGDGTFFHSGQLAIQACIAAGVNITYKILYNDVVAMTGAQDAQGALTVPELTHKLTDEGVARVIVVADEPQRHRRRSLAKGTLLWHRDRLDEAQRILRDVPGVTVLIYDQHCAADARRQRKRGTLPARNTRVVINEAVCEGCGDCGVKSNCLSVQPVDTEYGRKTRIDQTSCNTDYSCLDGDCPSFVTVEVDPDARPARRTTPTPPAVAAPTAPPLAGTHDVLMAGIGGTGIVTVNQVLAMAAMRAGFDAETLDQTGLSQKAGPVTGHLRFSPRTESGAGLEPSNRLTPQGAHCVLAFDLLAATSPKNLGYGDPATTVAVASTSRTPTGDMVYDASVGYPELDTLIGRLGAVTRDVHAFDALEAAEELFGSTTTANFLLVGAAYQAGALPIPAEAIEEAIRINGVAVDANVAAFRWGRVAVADPEAFATATRPQTSAAPLVAVPAVDAAGFSDEIRAMVARRASDLVGFQGMATAQRYVARVAAVRDAERAVTSDDRLTRAAAQYLFKLTAYKDEYEVARLLTDSSFADEVARQVPGGATLTYKLHPPVMRSMGRSSKVGFTPRSHVLLRGLARMKGLRGTPFDVFGYAKVRRLERRLAAHYDALLDTVTAGLSVDSYERAVRIAELPDLVRGYEDVKLRNVATYVERLRAEGVPVDGLV
ncbi:indolepyruvate ferredoxin oxidoreductase family protein [Mumia sp. zg.B53]|uniref:indolepyruvate ferredoxin oxidoreductase family protein n=1 Tax=Mumia sp. zg.B53 TaxID=2855449 RepID=UPI0021085F36|nr:indolepyruvate ferredoxin oxidoreductase family protein [Mumia sp. zg.B53]